MAQSQAPADTAAFPPTVRHRSAAESAAALPGRVLYLPFGAAVYGAQKATKAVWEDRLIERFNAWLTTADGRVGVRPLATTSLGGGVHLFHKDLAGAAAQLTSTLGRRPAERQHHLLSLAFGRIAGTEAATALHVDYARQSRERFFGSGDAPPSTYRRDDLTYGLTYGHRLTPAWRLDGLLQYRGVRIGPGRGRGIPTVQEAYAADPLPGFGRHHFTEAGLALDYDRRGRIAIRRARLSLGYLQRLDGHSLSHFRLGLAAQRTIELFYRRSLTLRLGTDWRFSPSGDEVAFYDLASLGGAEWLPGYRRQRFGDRGMVAAAAEYGFPIVPPGYGFLFYHRGRVLHRPQDFTLEQWKHSYGGGIRLLAKNYVVFEQILAFSPDQTRWRFSFKTAF